MNSILIVSELYCYSSIGPASGDCTFESGLCHWNNTIVNDMPWFLRKGKTGSQYTGPAVDHTLGTPNGKYCLSRSLRVGACNSTIFLSRRFQRSFIVNVHLITIIVVTVTIVIIILNHVISSANLQL